MSDPLRVLMSGPLSEFAAGFREELLGRGYRPGTSAKQLQLMAHASRWMACEGLGPDDLSSARVEEFVAVRRAAGYVNYVTPRALAALLEHLRAFGVVPPAGEPVLSEVEQLLGCYRA